MIGGVLMEGEGTHAAAGVVFDASLVAGLVGLLIFVTRRAGWITTLGVVLFLVLVGLAVALSDRRGMAGAMAGMLLPLSAFFLVGWIIWFKVGARQWRRRRLLARGLSAPAVLASHARSGVRVKRGADFPRYGVDLVLDVSPPSGLAFQAKAEELLTETEIAALREGMQLVVRYRPDDPALVAVESWPPDASGGG